MKTVVKIDLEKILSSKEPIIIELGCGKKKNENRVTVDRVDMPNVDIVADIENGLPFLPDNSVHTCDPTNRANCAECIGRRDLRSVAPLADVCERQPILIRRCLL